MLRAFIFSLLFALLHGCAIVKTNVSAFHEFSNPISGSSFAIVPLNEQQERSLEFLAYANVAKAEMEKHGLKMAPFNQANYAVFINYDVDEGKQVVSSYPIFGQTGGGSSFTSGFVGSSYVSATTTYRPSIALVGTGTSTSTEFTRFLKIDFVDIAKSKNGKIYKAYEARAQSTGASSQFANVIPQMIRSIFSDFPGKSGEMRTVTMSGQ